MGQHQARLWADESPWEKANHHRRKAGSRGLKKGNGTFPLEDWGWIWPQCDGMENHLALCGWGSRKGNRNPQRGKLKGKCLDRVLKKPSLPGLQGTQVRQVWEYWSFLFFAMCRYGSMKKKKKQAEVVEKHTLEKTVEEWVQQTLVLLQASISAMASLKKNLELTHITAASSTVATTTPSSPPAPPPGPHHCH